MPSQRVEKRVARRRRVRKLVRGNEQVPRLSVYRSLHHIYAQVISDETGRTLAACSTAVAEVREGLKSTRDLKAAQSVGRSIAGRCLERGVTQVVFDRNGFLYHGRIKALADAAREAGLKF